MLHADGKGYLMAAGMSAAVQGTEHVRADGLVEGHCYGVLRAVEAADELLLKLRNPWGKTEWQGDWSDNSGLWTAELKEELGFIASEDGTFWMCVRDFGFHFDGVYINRCHPDWSYRYIKPPPVVLPADCTSTTSCFKVVVPPSLREEHSAVLTVSQRDVRADTDMQSSSMEYAACTLSAVRVDNRSHDTAALTAGVDASRLEASVVIGSSVLLQGRESWLEADLLPGTYIVTAHMRRERPEKAEVSVPIVFSCYSPSSCILSAMDEGEAWIAQAEILREVTERLGTSDDTMYRHAHQLTGAISREEHSFPIEES